MTVKHSTKMVCEGEYMAEVEVELIYTDEGWSPCLPLEDAYKLDDVHDALRDGDIKSAARHAKVYTPTLERAASAVGKKLRVHLTAQYRAVGLRPHAWCTKFPP